MKQPGVDLIRQLENLRIKLNDSGVQRTKALLDGMGEDCSYYRKSLDIFLTKDYDALQILISDIIKLMEQLE